MKIKNDFVTNSSSCSYIVCIPDPVECVQRLEELMDLPKSWGDSITDNGDEIWFNMDGENSYELFQDMNGILHDFGYVLHHLDFGPDNQPMYINVSNYLKKINNIVEKEKDIKPRPKFKRGDVFKILGHKVTITEVRKDDSQGTKFSYQLTCNCCKDKQLIIENMSENDLIKEKKENKK